MDYVRNLIHQINWDARLIAIRDPKVWVSQLCCCNTSRAISMLMTDMCFIVRQIPTTLLLTH